MGVTGSRLPENAGGCFTVILLVSFFFFLIWDGVLFDKILKELQDLKRFSTTSSEAETEI